MKTTIYYFTGTGNSLAAARRIAAELQARGNGTTELRRMTATPDAEPAAEAERIGFVFPTYAYGLPRIVAEFAAAVPLPDNAYVFGVASNCGIPGPVVKQLKKILRKRGADLHAGFTVLDPSSSLVNDPDRDGIQRLMISANRGEFPAPLESHLPGIIDAVGSRRSQPVESSNGLTNFLGGLLYRMATPTFKSSGEHFWTNEDCSGCGTCARICPRNNITIENGKPVWGDDCELCHACIQWCPKSSIQYKHLTEDKERYRNPSVRLKDIVSKDTEAVHV